MGSGECGSDICGASVVGSSYAGMVVVMVVNASGNSVDDAVGVKVGSYGVAGGGGKEGYSISGCGCD